MCLFQYLVKYFVFFFNFLITLVALGLITIGVLAYLKLGTIIDEALSSINNDNIEITLPFDGEQIAIGIIVFGSVIFFIAFCGCCGSISENKCLLITFATLMAILSVIEIIVLVLVTRRSDNFKDNVHDWLEDQFQEENRLKFFAIEAYIQCCGTTGPEVYNNMYPNNLLPPTCCPDFDKDSIDLEEWLNNPEAIADMTCTKGEANNGCSEAIEDKLNSIINIVKYILYVTIAVELVSMLLSIYLAAAFSRKQKAVNYVYWRY